MVIYSWELFRTHQYVKLYVKVADGDDHILQQNQQPITLKLHPVGTSLRHLTNLVTQCFSSQTAGWVTSCAWQLTGHPSSATMACRVRWADSGCDMWGHGSSAPLLIPVFIPSNRSKLLTWAIFFVSEMSRECRATFSWFALLNPRPAIPMRSFASDLRHLITRWSNTVARTKSNDLMTLDFSSGSQAELKT